MDIGEKIKQRRLELGLTLEEVGSMVGVSKSTVMKWGTGYIENMKRDKIALLAKALRKSPLWVMGIEDLDNAVEYRTKKVPLLGSVAAGKPILACDEHESYVEIDQDLRVDFCLRVRGDSMIDARINDGDLVFVRRQPTVENGEIAVVLIDDEVTLKRFYTMDGGVILKPENSKYQPMYYSAKDFKQVRILGKAVLFQSEL